MDKKKILQHLDHTLLKQDATWEQIKTLCDEGMQYHVASVCIPPCYVKEARDYVADRLKDLYGDRFSKWLSDNSCESGRDERGSGRWCG